MKLNVYDKNANVVKECESQNIRFKFGHIRSIMELLNIDNINDTWELIQAVYGAWDKLTDILSECFPEMDYEDWENVPIEELIPELVQLFKDSFAEMLKIPQEKN